MCDKGQPPSRASWVAGECATMFGHVHMGYTLCWTQAGSHAGRISDQDAVHFRANRQLLSYWPCCAGHQSLTRARASSTVTRSSGARMASGVDAPLATVCGHLLLTFCSWPPDCARQWALLNPCNLMQTRHVLWSWLQLLVTSTKCDMYLQTVLERRYQAAGAVQTHSVKIRQGSNLQNDGSTGNLGSHLQMQFICYGQIERDMVRLPDAYPQCHCSGIKLSLGAATTGQHAADHCHSNRQPCLAPYSAAQRASVMD